MFAYILYDYIIYVWIMFDVAYIRFGVNIIRLEDLGLELLGFDLCV